MEIELSHISRIYGAGELQMRALDDVSLEIDRGELVAIVGPSGSGKSTLMNIMGLLDRPTHGELKLSGQPIDLDMHDRKLAQVRSEKIGFVFQTFNLLPRLTALQNVLMPTAYAGVRDPGRRERALALLEKVGLGSHIEHRPPTLSGGERQRVAIARALINDPDIILADEPTGNLDSRSGREIVQLLKSLNREGTTVVIITHDDGVASECRRTVRMFDGRIVEGEA